MKERTEYCKYCGIKIEPKTTRKQFCTPKCRVYWNREQLDFTKPAFTKEPLKSKVTYVIPSPTHYEGKRMGNLRVDEMGQWQEPKPDIQAQIDKLTAEKNGIKEGHYGTPMRNKIQIQIDKLKKLL